ncbi:MAG: PA14 domain-containing protein, partial [Thermoguttaceae bacterium]
TTGNSTGLGHFTNAALMPNQTSLSEDLTDIVITANAAVYISAAGNYTFDVDSDDGFGLTIPGVTFTSLTNATSSAGSDELEYNAGRGTADTFGVVDFPNSGYYPINLLYFNGGGPGSLEVAAAAGSYTSWNSSFELVGDSADGGLALGGAILDTTTPPAPTNLRATVTGNNTQITLNWSPVTGLPSGVDHYNIYRNGSLYATSSTTSYVDTSGISSQAQYFYQVTAVNYDGVEGLKSTTVTAEPTGIAAIMTPTTTSVQVQFTEPVDPVSAQLASNYQITTTGVTVTSAVLQSDDRTVLLTTSSALGTASHTLTISNVQTLALVALPTLTANFSYVAPGWNVTVYEANIGLNDTIAMAQTLVGTPSEQSWVKIEVAPYIDYNVTGGVLHFPSKERTLPGTTMGTETDNFAVTATGTMVVPAAGTYTFGVDSDDGFSLTITGATFTSVTNATNSSGTNSLQFNGGRGVADTLGVVTFASAGDYPISLLWFQGNGGAACELYAAQGTYTSFNSSMELVGDTADGGLSMGSTYIAPPFTVGVNRQSTNNPSPALTGTVTDPAALVTVRVNGSYYAATNNGDGTWSLPRGDIFPALGTGTYDVVAVGVNTERTAAFASTVNQLTVDTTSPTVSITPPPSPTASPVNSIAIHFSEPVENFTLQDLQMTLTTGGVAASEPLEGATLITIDNQNWTLGNLAGLTTASGTYALTLLGPGSTITDMFGNPLLTNATTSWTSGFPMVQSVNTIGSNITNASSVQYAVTFNESVTNVQTADFTLVTSGTTGTIASVSGSGPTYTVTVNNVSGNGTLGLNLVDNDSITDQFGNPLGGPGAGNGNFTGELFTIDTTGPTVATPASALPNPATGMTTGLSALGADIATGAASLTYSWAATTLPSGATAPTFSANGTNAAKNTTASFSAAGTYGFTVTITDPGSLTTTSSVNVTVNQTLTSIAVSPASVSLNAAATQQFTATALDQFGAALSGQPTFNWTTTAGSVATTGLLTASNSSVTGTVTATSGAISGSSAVTVTDHAPTVATVAAATPSPASGTTTGLSVLGADSDTGEGSLTYSWAATTLPSGATAPTFS